MIGKGFFFFWWGGKDVQVSRVLEGASTGLGDWTRLVLRIFKPPWSLGVGIGLGGSGGTGLGGSGPCPVPLDQFYLVLWELESLGQGVMESRVEGLGWRWESRCLYCIHGRRPGDQSGTYLGRRRSMVGWEPGFLASQVQVQSGDLQMGKGGTRLDWSQVGISPCGFNSQ